MIRYPGVDRNPFDGIIGEEKYFRDRCNSVPAV